MTLLLKFDFTFHPTAALRTLRRYVPHFLKPVQLYFYQPHKYKTKMKIWLDKLLKEFYWKFYDDAKT